MTQLTTEFSANRKGTMSFPLFLYAKNIRPSYFTLTPVIPLLFMMLLVSACATTTSDPLQYTADRNIAMQDEAEDKQCKLENLPYQELITRGNQHLSVGSAKLALLHFQMALKKQDDSVAAYIGLGEAMALVGDSQAAHNFLDKALLIDNQNRQALISTGKLYREEKNYEQAEISFNRVRKIYPDDPEILTELAITYGRMGDDNEAQFLFAKVVEQKPRDASALNNLGFNYFIQNNYVEAIQTLKKALSIEPDNLRTKNNLAAAYALNNQSKKAFNLFCKTGSEATAYNDLGYIYMMKGMTDPAKISFEKALKLHPRHYVRAKENLIILESKP